MTAAPAPAAIVSPCRKICRQDRGAGCCIGCGRTVREVFMWFEMSEPEREQVRAELPARLARLPQDRG